MSIAQVTDPLTNQKHEFYMDGKLMRELQKVKKRIQLKDFDYVMVLDGEEGSGKSTLAMQICKFIDPTFNLGSVYFNATTFTQGIVNSSKAKAHLFDEAFSGLSSRTALSEVNHILNSLIMEMRQRNLFVIIVLPTIFVLDKYPAMFRSRCLIHTYLKRGRRGRFIVFNRKKKNELILKGKKDYSYRYVKSRFMGMFTGKYVVNEQDYRRIKNNALKERDRDKREDKFKVQRDKLINLTHKELGMSIPELVIMYETYEVGLKRGVLGDILLKFPKERPTPTPTPK